jgi:outer membrane protein assembly factor BamA
VIFPIPVVNPTIGTGAALAGSMFFKIDEASSSSVIGAAGFYTNNGSWSAGLLASISLDEDRYRIRAIGAYADVNYSFYGIGLSAKSRPYVTLRQSGYLSQFVLQGQVAPNFYAGGQIRFVQIRTGFSDPELAADLAGEDVLTINSNTTVWTLGAVTAYDTRNRDYSPDAGELFEGEFNFGSREFVLSDKYLRLAAAYNRYDRITDDLVLATRASLCAVNGRAPLFDLCLFGLRGDLRGYPVGQYQDKSMFAAQSELRWHAFGRFGFVGFAGVGSIGPSFGQFQDWLAAGGVGIRFTASREYGVNVGIDGAINKSGETSLYFQFGEAF